MKKLLFYFLIAWGATLLLTSCAAYRNVLYFRNVPDSVNNYPVYSAPLHNYVDPIIKPKDLLVISVQTIEQQPSNTPINPQQTGVFNPMSSSQVDDEGFVEIPLVGKLKLAGLNTTEARKVVEERAAKFYNNPVVNVRFANFDVSVIGEVAHAGTFTFFSEKVGLLDAISQAGDLSVYGERNNVMLIREENHEKKFIRFDLNSSDIFSSPYYYLQHGDVIYVASNRAKVSSSDTRLSRTLTIVASVISITSIIIAFSLR